MSNTQQAIELLQQRAAKEEELKEIDSQLTELGFSFNKEVSANAVAKTAPTVTVGREPAKQPRQTAPRAPRQTRKPAATNGQKRGRGRPSKADLGIEGKQPPLEELLLELVEKSRNGLALDEMVTQALKAGYKSTSKNFHNMVQQAVGRMMKKKVLIRDNDSMRYFKGEAA